MRQTLLDQIQSAIGTTTREVIKKDFEEKKVRIFQILNDQSVWSSGFDTASFEIEQCLKDMRDDVIGYSDSKR